MNILAPGGHSYSTLSEALENIFPLNNIEHDKAGKYYLLPPHFLYSMPDVSDHKTEKHFHQRLGDIGEHLVFRALEHFSNTFSKIHKSNIVVINGLKVDDSNKPCFKRCNIWPALSENASSIQEFPNFETDFIIGRYFPETRCGDITVLEVKASTVISAADLPQQTRPPASYRDALDQLNIDEQFVIRLCKLATGYEIKSGQIVKIASCLSLRGFQSFVKKDEAKNIKFIMNEDVIERSEKSKPYYDSSNFYTTTVSIQDWLTKNLLAPTTLSGIPEDIYFILLRLLIFIKTCIIVPKSKQIVEPIVQVSSYVASSWVVSEGHKINTADILSYPTAAAKSTISKNSVLREKKKIGEIFRDDLNVMLLTLNQLDVWENQNKKLSVVGFAGTGKTILAMAKAIQLCRLGEKVVIVTPSDYVPTCCAKLHSLNDPQINENLIVRSNEELFACFSESFIKRSWYETIIERILELLSSLHDDNVTFWEQLTNEFPELLHGFEAVERFFNGANIIFDDVMTVHHEDLASFTHATISVVFALFKLTCDKTFEKTVWFLFDPIQHAMVTRNQQSESVVVDDEKWYYRKINPDDYSGWLQYSKEHYFRGRYPPPVVEKLKQQGIKPTEDAKPDVVDRDGSLITLVFLMRHASSVFGFCNLELSQSMRQCEEAFRRASEAYNELGRSSRGNLLAGLLWRPIFGTDEHGGSFPKYYSAHKIQGKTVIRISDGPAQDDFDGIAKCVIEKLQEIFVDGVPLHDVGVLVRSNVDSLRKAFSDRLGRECLSAKEGFQKTLVIDTAWNVPSFEWPIVIYVNEYDESVNPLMGSSYFRDFDYMCLSRCQSWIVELFLKSPPGGMMEKWKRWNNVYRNMK